MPSASPLIPTHERILAAAAQRLRRGPLTEITLSGVARSAGVSRQTVYQHFRDRDDLVASVFVAYADEHLAPARQRILVGPLGLAQLEQIFWTDVEAARSFFGEAQTVDNTVRVAIAEFILDSERMREYELGIWIPTLAAFAEAGLLRPGRDPAAVCRWLSYQQAWLVVHADKLEDERAQIRDFVLAPLLDT